ncbi:hypothetical protein KIN20_036069 [Parelaphostrongylus tenuis]|uniref:Uncharacterized protein n=1 Tax=Parelaphostrongylus tenuis TaxID=148309 RepID=A0AAD5RCP6_PARTN|nr:hypothetical protein KIN20_036069 [Parelaphostrongylus tenuis]
MEDKWGLDSLDFYLFEKVDFTEFPALRVLPGPTKIQQGDKMIFTGDKKREEQHAIFISSQIGCQNSTGNLTFTLIYVRPPAVTNRSERGACGFDETSENAETIYNVTYDVQDTCFGITASLVAWCLLVKSVPWGDNPYYEEPMPKYLHAPSSEKITERAVFSHLTASDHMSIPYIAHGSPSQHLSGVVDMGDGFSSVPLESIATGRPIRTASDLDCKDFFSCRWRAFGRVSKPWQMSSSILPLELIFNATGSYVRPEGTYALLYIEQDNKAPLDYLRSDPISCQSQTENTLSLR